ncbi:3-hydroxyacyl-ACP dehydratase FabZ family protein [Buchnera aphidicola (Mindarus keteleerifoliae)]|uniref:3-hydroxyacyl-ACP dehydratase FabZ family protein n=1 Tax=Buchnera aphidicola TaxID=9 RepID=UPI0031B6AE9D
MKITKKNFGNDEILATIPHRYPFLLLDQILVLIKNKYIKVIRLIKENDFFLVGHFPNYPVLPGIYIIEMMAQAGCFLLLKSQKKISSEDFYCLSSVERCSFRSFVFPKQKIFVEVFLKKKIL